MLIPLTAFSVDFMRRIKARHIMVSLETIFGFLSSDWLLSLCLPFHSLLLYMTHFTPQNLQINWRLNMVQNQDPAEPVHRWEIIKTMKKTDIPVMKPAKVVFIWLRIANRTSFHLSITFCDIFDLSSKPNLTWILILFDRTQEEKHVTR